MRLVRTSRLILFVWCCVVPVLCVAAEDDVWRAVFDRPEELTSSDIPVVCVLNIQHPEIIHKQLADKGADLYSGKRFRDRVQALAGIRCLHLHFTEVVGEDLDRPNVRAILIGGRSKVLKPDRDPQFFPLIRNTNIPMIGFCGGMQLIGKAFSAKVTSIRKLREGENDPNPRYHPGLFKEWGFLPVQITRRDPLFDGLPDEILVREAHAFHLPDAPPEFEVLAATAECPVEAFKHRQRLLYGTQFHPEAYDDDHPQGRVILENFLRLAGIVPQTAVESHPRLAAAELSEQERADGFVSLFDGQTLDGWQGDTAGYQAKDGILICTKQGKALRTRNSYGNFILRFEFKLQSGGNNGIDIRGMEIQILDDDAPKHAHLKPCQYHGSIYCTVAAERGHQKPLGQWNEQEIQVDGRHVKVVLNGAVIVDAETDHPALKKPSGAIGLKGHHEHVEFRNLSIKVLPQTEHPSARHPAG